VGDIWFALSFKERYKVVEQIVQLEKRLFSLQLPANGSIYFPPDLSEHKRSQSSSFPSRGMSSASAQWLITAGGMEKEVCSSVIVDHVSRILLTNILV